MQLFRRIKKFFSIHKNKIYLATSIALLIFCLYIATIVFRANDGPREVSITIICVGVFIHCCIALHRTVKKK